ncbi:hypothetical protein WJX72_007303 [[Myrmecia] bisecta]|uniref:Helitron helicase-like domain-containing protein n=1 Tax=[Myrmecia] bisecta TaxID=41462 RepID=A0AAW1R805_9CHLO
MAVERVAWRYLSIVEQPHGSRGIPVISANVVSGLLGNHQKRGPLAEVQQDVISRNMALIMDETPLALHQLPTHKTVFTVGTLVKRPADSGQTARVGLATLLPEESPSAAAQPERVRVGLATLLLDGQPAAAQPQSARVGLATLLPEAATSSAAQPQIASPSPAAESAEQELPCHRRPGSVFEWHPGFSSAPLQMHSDGGNAQVDSLTWQPLLNMTDDPTLPTIPPPAFMLNQIDEDGIPVDDADLNPRFLNQGLNPAMPWEHIQLDDAEDEFPLQPPTPNPPPTNAQETLEVGADGLPHWLSEGDADRDQLVYTAENTMLPYMFPYGTNYYDGSVPYLDYPKQKTAAMLSPFTLHSPCNLVHHQMRRIVHLANNVLNKALDKDIYKYQRLHPDATQQDVMKHVMKFSVPASTPGSPAYFRNQLEDLMAMVDAYGMPTLFLTLTADESSELRWHEYEDLEAFLNTFKQGFEWKDAPVESAKLFYTRHQAYFDKFVKGNGIFGRCTHHITRFEIQGRGSLHSHSILWIHPADVEHVKRDIIAAVPGEVSTDGHTITPPTNPTARRLYDILWRKQLHKCREGVCKNSTVDQDGNKKEGHCKNSFPFGPQPKQQPVFNTATQRWTYYRRCYAERNVVPYHPVNSLLWNAHTNVQYITQTSWSRYVMKYALKAEPTGDINLDTEAAARLGLNLSPTQMKTVAACAMSHPVCPTEAAMYALELKIVDSSDQVDFIDTAPPNMRSRYTSAYRLSRLSIPWVEK